MFKQRFVLQILALAAIVFGLWIAHFLVLSIVHDRLQYRSVAEQSVLASHPGSQVLVGPILKIDYEEAYTEERIETIDKISNKIQVPLVRTSFLYVLPTQSVQKADLTHIARRRGIYVVNAYSALVDNKGYWQLPLLNAYPLSEKTTHAIRVTKATVQVAVSDGRGIGSVSAKIDNALVAPDPQLGQIFERPSIAFDLTGALKLKLGYPAQDWIALKSVKISEEAIQQLPFDVGLTLTGMGALGIEPIAQDNTLAVSANWPHASYEGDRLPDQKESSAKGFSAQWKVSSLATAAGREWSTALANSQKQVPAGLSFGVRLIDPVDVHVLSDRASKYAMLFVLLTLASVFLFETFKRLRVHPVQYGLLGLSVVLFFLLLISLAEQIGFAAAYLVAASACCSLITFYASHALGSWKRAVPLGGGLAVLYAILFGILQSEENALVAGSVLIFVLLAALMIATRKTDWYALTQR